MNEYRTFITSRRDEVFENRETSASVFSYKRPPPIEGGRSAYRETEAPFDTDVKLHWENMVMMALQKPPEFEFQFKSAPVSPVLASLSHPDDDVFQGFSQMPLDHGYISQRGDFRQQQLYRRQVELEESSKRAPSFVVSQRTVPEPFSQLSPGSLTRMYQPKYSKFCVKSTDVPPVETSMDSRSSSFRSQTSMCEPTDRDIGDSTSRDSNGSSNDASSVSTDTTFDRAFEAYEHRNSSAITPTLKPNVTSKATPCPTDRRSMMSATNAECDKSTSNVSWLRSPLKWMGRVGAKKPPKSPRTEARTEHDHRTSARCTSKLAEMSLNTGGEVSKPRAMSRISTPPTCDDKNLINKRRSFLALPVQQPQGSKLVSDAKSPHGLKLKPGFSSDSSDVHSVVSTDRERDQSGILKIRERWLKYMKMLTPPYGKSSPKADGAITRGGSFPQQETPILRQEYVHTRPKSMPAILKTPPLRPRSNSGSVFQPSNSMNIPTTRAHIPPAGPSSAKKSNSFFSQSGSVVSSSPRPVKSSSPRLMSLSPKVKGSPKVPNTISPRMSSSSASSMSELHSAVQGAIAHCKQSHSGVLSPAGNPVGNIHRH